MRTILALLTHDEVKVALVTILPSLLTLFGTPGSKKAEARELALAVLALGGVVAAALGYKQGKLNEGTVPDGSKPANPGVQIHVGAGAEPLPPEELPGYQPLGERIAKEMADQATTAQAGVASSIGLLLIVGLIFTSFGCTGTSATFKAGAKVAAAHLVKDARHYELTPDESADVDNLERATADVKKIEVEPTAAAWGDVEPVYRAHVAADETLEEFIRGDLLGVADKFDDLIARERQRRRSAVGPLAPLVGR